MSGRITSDVFIGLALMVVGGFATYFALQINVSETASTSARTFPLIGSIALIVFGALDALDAYRGDPDHDIEPGDTRSVILLLAVAVVYLVVLTKLGYLISTALAAPMAMWLFSVRRLLSLIAASIVCPALYHVVFFELLGVFPPFGEWFDFLDILQR